MSYNRFTFWIALLWHSFVSNCANPSLKGGWLALTRPLICHELVQALEFTTQTGKAIRLAGWLAGLLACFNTPARPTLPCSSVNFQTRCTSRVQRKDTNRSYCLDFLPFYLVDVSSWLPIVCSNKTSGKVLPKLELECIYFPNSCFAVLHTSLALMLIHY